MFRLPKLTRQSRITVDSPNRNSKNAIVVGIRGESSTLEQRKHLVKENKNRGAAQEKTFFCLTADLFFSNQPADFLKQLVNLDCIDRFRTFPGCKVSK
jgi:hypothetical protein